MTGQDVTVRKDSAAGPAAGQAISPGIQPPDKTRPGNPQHGTGRGTRMSVETNMDVGLWEKFSDGLSSFSEGVVNFLGRLFGSSNERLVRSLGYVRRKGSDEAVIVEGSLLAQVNVLEEEMMALSDDELKALTPAYRERLAA